jgi:hypothetical protein
VEQFIDNPLKTQEQWFKYLISKAEKTEFGKKYGFNDIKKIDDYQNRVPITDYDDFLPYIERIMKGEQNLLWPSTIRWFAKSSGTTSSRSKFIPVSKSSLEQCHYKGGKDIITIYLNHFPESKLFSGKGLIVGGSHQVNHFDEYKKTRFGDISAVLMANSPKLARWARTPGLDVALMDEWEAKLEKMAKITARKNVTSMSGVPTWTVILLERILEYTGKQHVKEVWPHLELFIHGAVSFTPYREIFKKLIPDKDMHYLETYNASEGFFGIQDHPDSDGMLLLADHGIFYEFIPEDEIYTDNPKAITLDKVQKGVNYAIVISTNAGLWRYQIGDTVKFTSLKPYRIVITGRTKHFINAFGEEVIVENAEKAVAQACKTTGAIIDNFTAGPKYLQTGGNQGYHEWIIEFSKQPESLPEFVKVLDETLRKINSDYDAKRYKDIALTEPVVHIARENTFYDWLKKRGKLGGQNKVPRLSNDRKYLDDILEMLNNG